MIKRIVILLACLACCLAAGAQTYQISHYSLGIVQGGSSENLNNSAARRRNTIYSEITYGRKTPVEASVVIDEQKGEVTLLGPQEKKYRVDFNQGQGWTNAGRRRRFQTCTGKDESNNLDILFERIQDKDGNLIQVSVFGSNNVGTYYIRQQ